MSDNIYINIWDYESPLYPFQIFIGGRGTGKTYSALYGSTERSKPNNRFILMRRTSKEHDMLLDNDKRGEGLNPFKPINRNKGTNYGMKAINDNLSGIYAREVDENGKFIYKDLIGYGTSLVGVASIRGVSADDCTTIIYDEFIPEKHVKKIGKDGAEFEALMNAYETFNRNRELEDLPPMQLFMLANANDIYNEIFVGLGIVEICEKMKREGKTDLYLKSRKLAIHILPDSSEFTEQKKQTALYCLTRGTKFEEMSLHNKFAYNDFSLIGYRKLVGYVPLCHVDDMYIYKKKGSREYYICHAKAKCKSYNSEYAHEKRKFYQDFGCDLFNYYIESKITFETFDIKTRMLDMLS